LLFIIAFLLPLSTAWYCRFVLGRTLRPWLNWVVLGYMLLQGVAFLLVLPNWEYPFLWIGSAGAILILVNTLITSPGLCIAIAVGSRPRRDRIGLCPNCSYDLRGDLTSGCPECGWNRAEQL